jgi:hypothetical protein
MTRFAVALSAVAAVAGSAWTARVRAEVQYPWCAEYRGRVGGTNCGFVTYRQCVATISGVGGSCYRNPAYQPPAERPRRR